MAENDQKVHVMSQDERNDYDGMTIDETTGQPGDKPQEQARPEFRYQRPHGQSRGSGFSIHTLGWKDLLFGNVSWMTRIALGLGFLAIMGFVVVIIVPTLLTVVGIGLLIWLVLQLFTHL